MPFFFLEEAKGGFLASKLIGTVVRIGKRNVKRMELARPLSVELNNEEIKTSQQSCLLYIIVEINFLLSILKLAAQPLYSSF